MRTPGRFPGEIKKCVRRLFVEIAASKTMASIVIERSSPAARAKELATFIAEAGLSVLVTPATAESKPVYELSPDGSAFMEKARVLVEPGGAAKPSFDEFLVLTMKYVPRLFDGTVGEQGTGCGGYDAALVVGVGA